MEKLYFLQAFFPDCSHHEQAGWEQKWSLSLADCVHTGNKLT